MEKRRTIYWKVDGVLRRIGYVTLSNDKTTVHGIVLDPQVLQAELFRNYLRRQFDEI